MVNVSFGGPETNPRRPDDSAVSPGVPGSLVLYIGPELMAKGTS
jgi:hypothetical protein